MRKRITDERGQAIMEFAAILPVFLLVGFGLVDLIWMTKQAANTDYIANEVVRCAALHETTPAAPLPCSGGVTPDQYARKMARELRLGDGTQLTFVPEPPTPLCNEITGTCTLALSYPYKPFGAWFAAVTLSRNATASYVPPPAGP